MLKRTVAVAVPLLIGLLAMGGTAMASVTPRAAHSALIDGDGCTDVPDSYFGANFRPACDKHDACYSTPSHTDRLVCDQELKRNLSSACVHHFGKKNPLRYSCLGQAKIYYAGVRKLGRSHYEGQGDPA